MISSSEEGPGENKVTSQETTLDLGLFSPATFFSSKTGLNPIVFWGQLSQTEESIRSGYAALVGAMFEDI